MIILGIDPGTRITGYGVIRYVNNNFVKIANGSIKLPAQKSIPQRLEIIYDEINKIIKKFKPDEFAIETAFYGKNVQSADESDALAIALCHAFRFKTPVQKTKNWKSFIEAYPERVIS